MGANSIIPRACQNCRVRKTRCNRQRPCSNCLTSNISCTNTGQHQTAPPAPPSPQAVTANSREGHNIRDLIDRIASLEHVVLSLSTQLNQGNSRPSRTELSSPRVSSTHVESPASAACHGLSSFERQADIASRVSGLPGEDAAAPQASSPLADETRSLRAVIQDARSASVSSDHSHGTAGARKSEQVPAELAVRILRSLRAEVPLLFLFHPISGPDYLQSLAQHIYFPTKPVSVGEMAVFFGALYCALRELVERQEYTYVNEKEAKTYQGVCYTAFQAHLEDHELTAVPSYENTLALAIAALDAQMSGNLSAQWILSSAAARHCIALGYHRNLMLESLPPDDACSRRRLFWHVYNSDQSTVLTLGRAAIIQDYDVEIAPSPLSKDPGRLPWEMFSEAFTQFYTIQAKVWKRLYSPAAMRIDASARQRAASEIMQSLDQWMHRLKAIDCSQAHHREVFHQIFLPVDVAYYSVATLTLRGATMPTSVEHISEACFDAANKGLNAHLAAHHQTKSKGHSTVYMYAVWIMVYSSFTPFIITFLHCIANVDAEDLTLLGQVLQTLEELAAVCDACKRPFQVCQALHRTAVAYVESKRASPAQVDSSAQEKSINLPLHNPIADFNDWDFFQTSLDEWAVESGHPSSFTIGNRLNSFMG